MGVKAGSGLTFNTVGIVMASAAGLLLAGVAALVVGVVAASLAGLITGAWCTAAAWSPVTTSGDSLKRNLMVMRSLASLGLFGGIWMALVV